MKILHVIDRITKEFGGSAEVCRKQVKYLRRSGHDVTVYTGLVRNWNMKGFDIIHIHNYVTYQNCYTLLKHGKTPVVWQPHGGLVMHDLARFWISYPIKTFFKLRTAGFIAVSQQEIDQASEFIKPEKIHLVSNGIDLEDYRDLPERGLFRKKYDIPMDAELILYLGRKDWTKGIDNLIQDYNDNYRKVNNHYLAMVGVSESVYRVNNMISIPPLYEVDKLSAYVDADLFILPSKYEIFGLTPLEALACGTEVKVSEAAGVKAIIDKYPDRKELLSKYNWSVLVKDLINVYEAIISR